MTEQLEIRAGAERWGMVLAGGGARGAYQIGVWRALVDLGLADRITAVSGTSIGALNGALFVQGNLRRAEALWGSISRETIADRNSRWRGSHQRLSTLLEEHLDRPALSASPVAFYATCLNGFPLGTPTYFRLNGRPPAEVDRILRATAAVPLFFDPVEIDGVAYSDGGVGLRRDNVPVRPVYEAGCDHILVIHLDQRQVVDPRAYPDAHLIQVVPSEGLGFGLNGQLDFDPISALWRMERGYWDGLKQIADGILSAPKRADGSEPLGRLNPA